MAGETSDRRLDVVVVPGRPPSRNQLDAMLASGRGARSPYHRIKKRWALAAAAAASGQGMRMGIGPSRATWVCVEPDSRRDPSNQLSSAIKLIEDGLTGRWLRDDSQRYILEVRGHVTVMGGTRGATILVLSPCRTFGLDEALKIAREHLRSAGVPPDVIGHGRKGRNRGRGGGR